MRMKRRTALKMLGAGAGTAFLGAPQLVFGQEAGQIIVALDDILHECLGEAEGRVVRVEAGGVAALEAVGVRLRCVWAAHRGVDIIHGEPVNPRS